MFGLVVALVVMVLLDAVEDLKTGVRVTLSVLLVIIGLLWDVLLRVGQSQAILNIGSLTLGFCVIYYYLHQRENTMMLTAATLGAVSGIAPGFGVAFLHYRNGELGYRHFWTPWVFYAVYPAILLACACMAL